jgi:hypothetical protein
MIRKKWKRFSEKIMLQQKIMLVALRAAPPGRDGDAIGEVKDFGLAGAQAMRGQNVLR